MTPPLNWQELYTKVLGNAIINKKTSLKAEEIPHVFIGSTGEENPHFLVNPDLWKKIPDDVQEELKAFWEGRI